MMMITPCPANIDTIKVRAARSRNHGAGGSLEDVASDRVLSSSVQGGFVRHGHVRCRAGASAVYKLNNLCCRRPMAVQQGRLG
jgi:hypothetical protein